MRIPHIRSLLYNLCIFDLFGGIMKIKPIIRNAFIILCFFFVSCSDLSNNITVNNPDTSNTSSEQNEEPSVKLYTRILRRDINRTTWYVATISNHYSWYRFYDGKVSHQTGQYGNSVVGFAEGKYSFVEDSKTKIKYKWNQIAGDPNYAEILILDNDILIFERGFETILYKDISAYTENTPFMGLGRYSEHSADEWIVFTPSGNCYKRYTDYEQEDFVIACGTWTKNSDDGFKIYWDGNTKDYDILKGTKLYQNININKSIIPVSLFVNQ